MPYMDDKDAGWLRVQERLAEALAPFAADLGARECAHGDWVECEAEDGKGCAFDDSWPKAGAMPIVSEFVLVVVTADMANDDHDIGVATSPNMRNHTTKGLLHVALNE